MTPFFFYATFVLSIFPSLCIGRSLENRLESLEQTVHILQTALVEKDNRISHLENQLYEVNERVKVLELLRDQEADEPEMGMTNDEVNADTKVSNQESNEKEISGKILKRQLALDYGSQSNSKFRRFSDLSISTRQFMETPPKIAFHAFQRTDHTYGTHETLQFDVEAIDIGGGYNSADSIYDVPVSGVYVFTWTIVTNAHTYHAAELLINGNIMGSIYADSETSLDHHVGTGLIVAQVNQGDHVFVRMGHNTGGNVMSDINHGRTTFTGWMLFTM